MGKSMIERVYEQASKATLLSDVIVATDHQQIYDHVVAFGGKVCMTNSSHQSGTDRCAEVLHKQSEDYDYVINIQGDEPLIDPHQIDTLAECLDDHTSIATLAKKIENIESVLDPNIVKVVLDKQDNALYFSRHPIPFAGNIPQEEMLTLFDYYKHIGIYAYKADVLREITKLPQSNLEKAESLEQLRWLENGYTIKVALTNRETIGIDSPKDLDEVLKILASQKN